MMATVRPLLGRVGLLLIALSQVPHGAAAADVVDLARPAPADEPTDADEPAGGTPTEDAPLRSEETAASDVVPPEAISTPVSYPPGASGDAEVLLELVVAVDGSVQSASSVRGDPEFAEAAIAEALAWTFSPATRQKKPVAAKIFFLVRFEEVGAETLDSEADTSSPANPKEAASDAGALPVTEIVVEGEIEDRGRTTITRAEARNIPGTFDDPLRSIEVMPGVTPIAQGLPMFFVRGAPPGNVGFFVDGIRIPLLYHAFLGPSVLHPAFLEKVDLYAGAAPVRRGRYAGAIVEAELARPEREWRGEANVRLIDAGAFAEAPWGNGRGYALLGGRYSYTALLLSLANDQQEVEYWDYQALVGYDVTPRDTVSVFTFGAFDYAGSKLTDELGGTEFHRVDLRWDHRYDETTRSRLALTWGSDRTRSNAGHVADSLLAGRFHIERRDSEDLVVRAGADVTSDEYELAVDPATSDPLLFERLFPARRDVNFGVWSDLVLWPRGRVTVTPGVRADVYRSLGDTAVSVDPRIQAMFRLTDDFRAIHTLGVAHQTANFVPAVPGAQVAGLEGGLQRAIHASSTYEADLPGDVSAAATAFLNGTRNLSDPIGLGQSLQISEDSPEQRAFGRSVGFELHLRRPLTRRLGGLVSYTFSRAFRSHDSISTISGYDRPHVLHLAASYDFGNQLRASTKWAYASGIPGRRTTVEGYVFDGSRSRPYMRLDLKLSKRWVQSSHFWWGVYGEVLNALHSSDVIRRACTPRGCVDESPGAITIPSIGIEASWH